jgi:hypothetical protein
LIRGPVSSYRRPIENLPGAGHYDGHLKSIGASIKTNVNMGSKYVFKADSNPGAGYYDPDKAVNQTQSKSRAAHINGETSPYRRPKENLPGPGHHDGHLDAFGSKITHKMDFGNKYVFKPDRNPPPGAYDIDSGHNMSKFKSRAAHIN